MNMVSNIFDPVKNEIEQIAKSNPQYLKWLGQINEEDRFESGGFTFGKIVNIGGKPCDQNWCDRDVQWVLDQNVLIDTEEEELTIEQAVEPIENVFSQFDTVQIPTT